MQLKTFKYTYHVRRFLPYKVQYLGPFLDPLPTVKSDVIYGRSLIDFTVCINEAFFKNEFINPHDRQGFALKNVLESLMISNVKYQTETYASLDINHICCKATIAKKCV